ncbi:MAG: PIN domain-containing protein [Planctomycetales bacterium]|nr:PIN domain-containing protein [Planctomycetales bacterium]MCA9170019.1 PIN domain-containing protein [Planctomycetales bacterium]
MALIALRSVFLLVAAGLSVTFIRAGILPEQPAWSPWAVFVFVMGLAAIVIGIDTIWPRKRIETITAVYFGVLIGLFLTYIIGIALTPIVSESYRSPSQLVLGMVLCYTCISVLIQTKDDFRFIIPYVEFAKEVKGIKPYILDTSVVIDGRIADVVEARVFDNQLIMPRFVLAELQSIADSSDKLRRSRGRRGLDILNRLRSNPDVDLKIYDRELPEAANQPVDMKLVLLAKRLEGKLVTGDYNLNKVARLHNVEVLNLNDLANALKPVFLPGEHVTVRVVKPGEEDGQGVGYLDDGTMIVIEGGRSHINQNVRIAVTSVLQTSAGRMIFGRYESEVRETA